MLGISLCLFVLAACTANRPHLWLADSIVSAGLKSDRLDSKHVSLKLPDQVIAASISRSVMKELLDVHAKIDAAAQVHSKLYITNRGHPWPNAYAATLDGVQSIAINLNMLELIGDDKNMYAALIAHEIAHHMKQHRASAALIENIFTHHQETEADELGLQLMFQAGYALSGALGFYEKLTRATEQNTTFLSLHPSGEERLKHIRQVIESLHQE